MLYAETLQVQPVRYTMLSYMLIQNYEILGSDLQDSRKQICICVLRLSIRQRSNTHPRVCISVATLLISKVIMHGIMIGVMQTNSLCI